MSLPTFETLEVTDFGNGILEIAFNRPKVFNAFIPQSYDVSYFLLGDSKQELIRSLSKGLARCTAVGEPRSRARQSGGVHGSGQILHIGSTTRTTRPFRSRSSRVG